MVLEIPKVKQLVEVVLGDNHPYSGYYPCIVKKKTARELFMTAPVKMQKVIPIKVGESVTVYYWVGTKAYSFKSIVTAVQFRLHPSIGVALPREIKQLKRRKYFRVQANISVTYTMVRDGSIYHTHTLDISGGGVSIKSPIQLPKNEYLEMQLTIPQRGVVNIQGKVVRCEKKTGVKEQYFLVGVDFAVINERDRDRIISYLFERQRYLLKNRLF